MRSSILAVAAIVIVGACAKEPDKIAATPMEDSAYSNMSCRSLATTRLDIQQQLDNLSASQKSAANGDAWGVFLLGLPVSSMSGNDKEAAISVAKGKIQAIDRVRERKGCR